METTRSESEQKEYYWLKVFEGLYRIYGSSDDDAVKGRVNDIARLLDYDLNLAPPVESIFHLAEHKGRLDESQYQESFEKAFARLEELDKK